MSAADAALAVLEWALFPAGPPPRGDVFSPARLLQPGPELKTALSQLAAVAAARLRLGNPPLGEKAPPSLDAGALALAISLADLPFLAAKLVDELPRTRNAWEWVLRHGLAAPAHPHLAPDLAVRLRSCSPLTMLLDHPPEDMESDAVATAQRLIGDRAGRRALQLALAQPSQDAAVRRFRGRLLERLRLTADGQDFVLAVYEAAMVHHETEHVAQARAALAALAGGAGAPAAGRLDESLATADWWGPLWAIERIDVAALRARLYLGYAYREGLRAYGLRRRMGVVRS